MLGTRSKSVAAALDAGQRAEPRALRRGTTDSPRQTGKTPAILVLVTVLLLVGAVILRFWVRSELWLDEAQTVSIARLPLTQIPAALRHDGSPPLYYFLLHFWMRAFGTSDVAIRSLSGVLGTMSLPLAWLAGRRMGARAAGVPGSRSHGHPVGWAMTVLLATLPFAIRYSTENRMYMLVVVLVLAGYLTLESALIRPTLPRLAALGSLAGLLALTHYWCLYLLASVAAVLLWLSFRPPRGVASRAPAKCLVALGVGSAALFGPWAPDFLFQMRHTGTPWAPPATLGDLGWTVTDYSGLGTGIETGLAQLVSLLLVGLALLGLFGRRLDGRGRIEIDLRGRGAALVPAFVFLSTVVLGLLLSRLFGTAFAPRYAAVALVPFLLVVALGIGLLADRRVRIGVLGVLVAAGLAGSIPNITSQRTQAPDVAATITQWGRPGDLVVYCPDQLGPGVERLLPGGRYEQVALGAGQTGVATVDWVDYVRRAQAARPDSFMARVSASAPASGLWLVWSPDYPVIGAKCSALLSAAEAFRPGGHQVFGQDQARYFEHAFLEYFPPE